MNKNPRITHKKSLFLGKYEVSVWFCKPMAKSEFNRFEGQIPRDLLRGVTSFNEIVSLSSKLYTSIVIFSPPV